MRVTVKRDEFARLLAQASRVVETRNTIPILSHVMLNANDGAISVAATDLDIEFKDSCAAEVEESGATCVDAKMLADIVKRAAADVTLYLGDQLLVKTGRSRFKLNVLPVDDFPSMEAGTFSAEFDVDLAGLVGPVQFAMSNEATRFYLCGVCLEGNGEHVTATATDGHRLATKQIDMTVSFESIILPRKFVGLIPQGNIKFAVSNSKVRVATGEAVLTSKLIDGTFPDYERVIPKSNDKILIVNASALRSAASRMSVVTSERGKAIKLSIAEDLITLTVNNPDVGNATEEVSAGYNDDPVDIGFNSQYLNDVLSAFSSGEVTVSLANAGSPALVTCGESPGTRAVLMPMRI